MFDKFSRGVVFHYEAATVLFYIAIIPSVYLSKLFHPYAEVAAEISFSIYWFTWLFCKHHALSTRKTEQRSNHLLVYLVYGAVLSLCAVNITLEAGVIKTELPELYADVLAALFWGLYIYFCWFVACVIDKKDKGNLFLMALFFPICCYFFSKRASLALYDIDQFAGGSSESNEVF